MSDDLVQKAVTMVPPDMGTFGQRVDLRNRILALLAENKRLRKALEKAIAYIELVADDTDGEERAEARQDIAAARAALQGDSQ